MDTHDEEKKLGRQKDERVAAVLAELSATGEGQFFLRWLMDETGAFKQEFAPDDRTALFYAGRRSFGLQVLEKCAAVGVAHTLLTRRTPE